MCSRCCRSRSSVPSRPPARRNSRSRSPSTTCRSMARCPLAQEQSDFARDTIKVLKKHRIPPSYGFINANKLERNPDGAQALQIWVKGGHPLANHTYTHLDLTKNSVEDFQREILRNEPALELLMPPAAKGGRLALVPLSIPARRRHAREAARGARIPRQQRLPHRADHARLRGLPVEQRTRALLDEEGRGRPRLAARELSHRRARIHQRWISPIPAPSSAATSTT